MRWVILPLALIGSAAAQPAPPNLYAVQNEMDERPSREQKLVLPAFPKEKNLARIQVDGEVSFDFFVDLESVSVGGDGIVRYSLVARSAGGATNIAYEGIRCQGRERKPYAFGRSDGAWSAARKSRWTSISTASRDLAQATLHDAYFCPAGTIVRDAAEAQRLLREGGDPRVGADD